MHPAERADCGLKAQRFISLGRCPRLEINFPFREKFVFIRAWRTKYISSLQIIDTQQNTRNL